MCIECLDKYDEAKEARTTFRKNVVLSLAAIAIETSVAIHLSSAGFAVAAAVTGVYAIHQYNEYGSAKTVCDNYDSKINNELQAMTTWQTE